MHSIATDGTINTARQVLYRFASLSFLDPRQGTWSVLTENATTDCARAAAELYRDLSAPAASSRSADLSPRHPGPSRALFGELPLSEINPDAVLRRLPNSVEELNAEFERTFGLLVSGNCPPYETEYINGKFTFQRSQHLADVAGFYRAFGLQPSCSHPERPDHVVLQLEFMAFLIGLEQRAASEAPPNPGRQRRVDLSPQESSITGIGHRARTKVHPTQHCQQAHRVEICRDAQRRFLKEHLAWWTPTFAALVERQSPESFYAAAGRLLAALITAERNLFGLQPPAGNVAPSKIERPEECEGCLLQMQ